MKIKECVTCGKLYVEISPSKKRKYCTLACYWEKLKGNKLHLGHSLGEEAKHKISEANKGNKYVLGKNWKLSESVISKRHHPLSEEHRRQISISLGGNGQSDRTNKRYYHLNDKKYKEWKTAVFIRDNYVCRECGAEGRRGVYLEPHHIKGWAKFKNLRYVLSNGITLCKECHKLKRKVK